MNICRGALSFLRLFRWCHHNWDAVNAPLQWFADKLKCSLRTVKRYLEVLRGRLVRVQRRARQSSVYELSAEALEMDLFGTSSTPKNGTSSGPIPYKEKTIKTHEERTQRKPPASEGAMNENHHPSEGFEPFFGLFLAAGKALNHGDFLRAHALWTRLTSSDKLRAMVDARQQLERTADAHFVPLPENYLRTRPWTRIAQPRTLPVVTRKEIESQAQTDEIERRLLERRLGRTA